MIEQDIERRVWEWTYQAYGKKPKDGYFVEKWSEQTARGEEIKYVSPVDGEPGGLAYVRDRVYGWQAGGDDRPSYGFWADPNDKDHFVSRNWFSPVPAFPGDVVVNPPTDPGVPDVPPTAIQHIVAALTAIADHMDSVDARLLDIRKKQDDSEAAILDSVTRLRNDVLAAVRNVVASGLLGGLLGKK